MNNKRCVFPNCHGKNSLIHVSKSKRYQILNSHRIYIPNNSVVCKDHIDDEKWKNCISLVFKYTSAYIEDMVDLLRNPKQCERDSFFSPKKLKRILVCLQHISMIFSMICLHFVDFSPKIFEKQNFLF